jgi:hypothetical protein
VRLGIDRLAADAIRSESLRKAQFAAPAPLNNTTALMPD